MAVDVRIIQEILGHAQLDTAKFYLRLVPDDLRKDYDNRGKTGGKTGGQATNL